MYWKLLSIVALRLLLDTSVYCGFEIVVGY